MCARQIIARNAPLHLDVFAITVVDVQCEEPQELTGQKKVNERFNTFVFCASQASDNWLLFDDVWFWSVRAE